MTAADVRPLPGGPLAVDLLNTTWREGDETVDWFDNDGSVREFASSWEHHLPARDLDALKPALVDARGLVQHLFEQSATAESAPAQSLVDEVNTALASARAVLRSGDTGLTLVVTGDQPANALAIEALVNAVELRRDRPGRVRSCAHDDCVLWFLDTSKSGRRRWCSMETCGNRAKAKRHYERSTQPEN